MTSLSLTLPPDLVDEIAERVADLLAQRNGSVPDYLTPAEAADYLRTSRQRIYDLTSQGRLMVCKDGSRNLYRREALDAYLDGATS
jgi:excisionase family DNA binding protein